MATTEPGISPPATTSEVGRHLRTVRKAQGLSRSEVARSAGLTRRELAAYERGRIPVPDSDLWCLAGSCGVDVSELLPSRDKLGVGSDLGSLTVGDSVARLRAGASSDGLLREYLAMIYELRNLPPGTRPPMREEDLAALADTLGGTPEAIEARLHELIGVPREEAVRLRAMILPPRSLPAASATPLPDLSEYAQTPFTPFDASPFDASPFDAAPAAPMPPAFEEPAFDFAMASSIIGDPAATDRFFGAPHVDDPFASPPPLEPLAPLASAAPAPTAPAPEPAPAPAAFDPFAPPTAAPIDPFASANGGPAGTDAPPAPPTMPTFDPFAPVAPASTTDTPLDAPGAFDPDIFDPTTFDLAAFAGDAPSAPADDDTAPFVADLGDDAAYALEVVALRPDEPAVATPEPAEMEVVTPVAVPPEESWIETWDTRAEHGNGAETTEADPLAALRVPLDEVLGADAVEGAVSDPFGPEPGFAVPMTAAEPEVDPFVDAYEPLEPLESVEALAPAAAVPDVVLTDVEAHADGDDDPDVVLTDVALTNADGDDDPDGAWFDRDADTPTGIDPDPDFDFDFDPDPDADADPDPDFDFDFEADFVDALVAAPVAGLAPISWSLFPPAASEPSTEGDIAEATDEPDETDETEADAVTDADVEAPTVSDAQFVAAGTDWQIGGIFPATAMADDGTLALRRADVRWALADLVAGDDFTARATVDFTSGAGFGILFRVSVDDTERISGYSFDVDPIYGGGGFLLRQWHDNRQHWKPLAHAPVADPTRLYGHHTIDVQLRADQLTASVDGEVVLTVRQLSRCSIDSGREPCHGTRLGVQAWSTTEVTVDRLLLAN